MTNDSKNLIFLISQPRSGSSLTQQLLLNSETISSSPESWQMLSLIHTYKQTNISDDYNPKYAAINFIAFLSKTENGLDNFKDDIKKIALSLYNKNTKDNGFFLDKTPRYYHIIDELYELFPEAKFIFLVRNPLSVFASMLDYNFNGNYLKFLGSKDRIEDLFSAPIKIERALKTHQNNILIKYEDVIENPKKELSRIFNYLEIDLPNDLGTYKIKDDFVNANAVDTKSLHKHTKPSDSYLDTWQKSINNTQKKILALGYIEELNKRHFDYFEYDLNKITSNLRAFKPENKTLFNLSFKALINKEEHLPLKSLLKKRLILKLQTKDYV